jgi:hypothetical protein
MTYKTIIDKMKRFTTAIEGNKVKWEKMLDWTVTIISDERLNS